MIEIISKKNPTLFEVPLLYQRTSSTRFFKSYLPLLPVCMVTSALGRLWQLSVMEKTVTMYELPHASPPLVHWVSVELQWTC